MTDMTLRPTERGDLAALEQVVQATGLFPSEMLAEMLAPALTGERAALWLSCVVAGAPVGLSYAEPEALTDGTWNLRALAVHPTQHGAGRGAALVRATEDHLRAAGQRLLIVETSGTEAFAPVRRFYGKIGYSEEARIPGFWAAGDDKVIFRKTL
ncbi:GNAT family N-acetyltransferase [uncultured Roseobacter sp.]|uniref:GNAT family N-acetyltransferase n=1 Tax=uncultured Roseobacter sp. TaxID=114847 RepID=UPI00262A9430|nr:GNAT family N-acetyltransferase [uncultured Roseobacter sp.]